MPALALLSTPAASDIPRWCGPKLVAGDGDILVGLPGRLTVKTFSRDVWDERKQAEASRQETAWILQLDYETPVLTDVVGGNPGTVLDVLEVQLWANRFEADRIYKPLENTHVLVTGKLRTSYFPWQFTDVHVEEVKVEPFGPVTCDGTPIR